MKPHPRRGREPYLTCKDFREFDVCCYQACHSYEDDLYDVTLFDGSHAWTCCPIKIVLMRRIDQPATPESKLLAQIFQKQPDERTDALIAAFRIATNESDKLAICLRYVHYVWGRHSTGRHTRKQNLSHESNTILLSGNQKLIQPAVHFTLVGGSKQSIGNPVLPKNFKLNQKGRSKT